MPDEQKPLWPVYVSKPFRRVHIGNCRGTLEEVKKAVGPWHVVEGGVIIVFAPPPRPQSFI